MPRPPADYARARLDPVGFAEFMVAELLADLQWVRESRQVGRVAQLTAQISVWRLALDDARAAAGGVFELERSPEAVATEAVKMDGLIRRLAQARSQPEAQRGPRDREL